MKDVKAAATDGPHFLTGPRPAASMSDATAGIGSASGGDAPLWERLAADCLSDDPCAAELASNELTAAIRRAVRTLGQPEALRRLMGDR